MPTGIPWGRTVIVEFDPDSFWYATASNIIANCLKANLGADYHAFSTHPDDVRSFLSKLAVDVPQAEKAGLLWIIDYYSPGIGAQSKEKWTVSSLKLTDISIDRRQRWQVQRPCLHLDDNWSVVFEHNDEKSVVQFLRTKIIPGTRATQRVQLLGISRGMHSDYVYKSLEDAAYGVVDIKTQEVANELESLVRVRSLKGEVHDSAWHRILLNENFEMSLEHRSPGKI